MVDCENERWCAALNMVFVGGGMCFAGTGGTGGIVDVVVVVIVVVVVVVVVDRLMGGGGGWGDGTGLVVAVEVGESSLLAWVTGGFRGDGRSTGLNGMLVHRRKVDLGHSLEKDHASMAHISHRELSAHALAALGRRKVGDHGQFRQFHLLCPLRRPGAQCLHTALGLACGAWPTLARSFAGLSSHRLHLRGGAFGIGAPESAILHPDAGEGAHARCVVSAHPIPNQSRRF